MEWDRERDRGHSRGQLAERGSDSRDQSAEDDGEKVEDMPRPVRPEGVKVK
jgi:hypothetical protein